MLKRVVRAIVRLLSVVDVNTACVEGLAIDDGGFAVVVGDRACR